MNNNEKREELNQLLIKRSNNITNIINHINDILKKYIFMDDVLNIYFDKDKYICVNIENTPLIIQLGLDNDYNVIFKSNINSIIVESININDNHDDMIKSLNHYSLIVDSLCCDSELQLELLKCFKIYNDEVENINININTYINELTNHMFKSLKKDTIIKFNDNKSYMIKYVNDKTYSLIDMDSKNVLMKKDELIYEILTTPNIKIIN